MLPKFERHFYFRIFVRRDLHLGSGQRRQDRSATAPVYGAFLRGAAVYTQLVNQKIGGRIATPTGHIVEIDFEQYAVVHFDVLRFRG